MRRTQLALVVVLAIAAAACSPQDPEVSVNEQVPADQQVAEAAEGEEGEAAAPAGADFAAAEAVWVADGLAFTEAPDSMPADGAVIGLEIIGGIPHNVVFEGFQGDTELVEGAGEGQFAASVSVPAGTYTYYCSIAGHRAAGMEGEITVG